ncbi:MAG: hypothetical protein WEC79_06885 [Thermomicrobiales bacterium]
MSGATRRAINYAAHLCWKYNNVMRITGRVTTICERVVFVVTGQIEKENRTSPSCYDSLPGRFVVRHQLHPHWIGHRHNHTWHRSYGLADACQPPIDT